MLLGLLLTLNITICLALIAVVLLQRSEGGAFGSGSPTGLITTRGAGDLLTRTTWVLFSLFLAISLALTLIGGRERSSQSILNRLKLQTVNPGTLTRPQQPPTPPTSAPSPLLAPASTPPPSAPVPARSGPAANFSAPRPKVRIAPASPNLAPSAAPSSNAPSPSVPKLLAPTPPPLQVPPAGQPSSGDKPVPTGPQ